MYVLSVTFGRSYVSSFPHRSRFELSEESWSAFKRHVIRDLSALAVKRQLEATDQHQPDAYFIEVGEGVGEYEGTKEPNCKVTVVSEFRITGIEDTMQELAVIARDTYFQEAIAVTRGESELYLG